MEMEKRVLLAIFLIAVILVLSNLVLTPPQGPEEGPGQVTGVEKEAEKKESVAPADTAKVEAAPQETAPVLPTKIAHEETIRVETDLYRLGISSRGGRLISMELKGYDSYTGEGGVKLIPPKKSEFMAMRVTLGKDTLDLAGLEFSPSRLRLDASEEQQTLLLSRTVGGTESIELRYDFTPGEYVIGVHVKIPGAAGRSDVLLQTDLLPRLLPTEEDSLKNDIRYFGTVMGGTTRSGENVDGGDRGGSKGESSYKEGPFIWAGVRNKYFVAAIISKGDPIKGVVSRGSKEENRIGLTALMPVSEALVDLFWPPGLLSLVFSRCGDGGHL
jgi:YidC/Oxa1 family membrane protein insertase